MILLLLACTKGGPADDTAAATACPGDFAVLTTASDDYSVGALATVCLDDLSVQDSLASIAGDAQVEVSEGAVWVLNRSSQNSLRRYEPGLWGAPTWEVSTGEGSNPQSVAVCGDRVWVSRYESNSLLRLDPADGAVLGEVDLSTWADDDGLAELSDLVAVGDTLVVAAQQLDRDNGWLPAGGAVLALSCADGALERAWNPGPNPTLEPVGDGRVLVRTGVYFDAAGASAYDGTVRLLDVEGGNLGEPILQEGALQRNVGAAALAAESLIALSSSEDWRYQVLCQPLAGGSPVDLVDTTAFLPSLRANRRGEVWVTARSSWADASAAGGVRVVDAAGCAVASDGLTTTLDPVDIAFWEE